MARPPGLHPVDDVGIEAGRQHQREPPPVDHPHVEGPGAASSDHIRDKSAVARNAEIACQQVFSPERQNGQRHPGEAVRQVAHGPVTAGCYQADQVCPLVGIGQPSL